MRQFQDFPKRSTGDTHIFLDRFSWPILVVVGWGGGGAGRGLVTGHTHHHPSIKMITHMVIMIIMI